MNNVKIVSVIGGDKPLKKFKELCNKHVEEGYSIIPITFRVALDNGVPMYTILMTETDE